MEVERAVAHGRERGRKRAVRLDLHAVIFQMHASDSARKFVQIRADVRAAVLQPVGIGGEVDMRRRSNHIVEHRFAAVAQKFEVVVMVEKTETVPLHSLPRPIERGDRIFTLFLILENVEGHHAQPDIAAAV